MDDLLAQFLIEGRDLVEQAHGDLRSLAAGRTDGSALDSLFRAIHTLKGSVALFAMAPAETLLHAAESLLQEARRSGTTPSTLELDAIVEAVDQVDRWIDAIETGGALDADASRIAAQLIAALKGERGVDGERGALPQSGAASSAAGTVFRFTPDADCFFRGEDPLATLATVPDLISLDIRPTEPWPLLDRLDPFRCVTRFEGVSGAGADAVRAAFRLLPDQIEIIAVAEEDEGAREESAALPQQGGAPMLRVEAAELDRLASQTGELVVAVNALQSLADEIATKDPALATTFRQVQTAIEQASVALRHSVAKVRLVSLQPVLRRLPRLARELAASLDKQIDFTLSGDESRADKQIADGLFEPLLHLVRNAIDHGIETPGEREAAGKPVRGKVALSIAANGERLDVRLKDDGRGMSAERIRSAAVAKGVISSVEAAELSDQQTIRLIFARGFSTAQQVTDVSGRGVGMDAVAAALERLQGTIDIDSAEGVGTTISILLPLAAITTRLLTVEAAGARYAVRFDQLSETARLADSDIQAVGQGKACVIRDRTIPVVDLGEALGAARDESDLARLIVSHAGGEPVAFRVSAFGERLDAIVRERDGLIAALPNIMGTALLADGNVLLVLDLAELSA